MNEPSTVVNQRNSYQMGSSRFLLSAPKCFLLYYGNVFFLQSGDKIFSIETLAIRIM